MFILNALSILGLVVIGGGFFAAFGYELFLGCKEDKK